MSIYKSNLVKNRMRHRGLYDSKDTGVAGRIFLPSGTVLTTADDFLFVPVGENQAIHKLSLLVFGDTSTIAGSIGTFQMVDADNVAISVKRYGPFSDAAHTFTSAATSAAAFRTAGQLDGYTETVLATPAKLAGPTNVGIRITTGGTIAADTELYLTVYFKGENSGVDVVGHSETDDTTYLI